MLVLSRRKGQTIVVDEHIEITVLEVEGDVVKLGISAPKHIQIIRQELLQSVKETNEEAVTPNFDARLLSETLKKIKKKNLEKL